MREPIGCVYEHRRTVHVLVIIIHYSHAGLLRYFMHIAVYVLAFVFGVLKTPGRGGFDRNVRSLAKLLGEYLGRSPIVKTAHSKSASRSAKHVEWQTHTPKHTQSSNVSTKSIPTFRIRCTTSCARIHVYYTTRDVHNPNVCIYAVLCYAMLLPKL